jgi:pimeloyl-ACP methyl ester carboxylesterase
VPGLPEFFLNTTHPSGLERDFTVVWWDQGGADPSLDPDIPADNMTIAQMIADTVAVTQYLLGQFGQKKVYLLGRSWGSYLGLQVAIAAPQLFHAYIRMDQMSHQWWSKVGAHQMMMDQHRVRENAAMVRKLQAAPVSMTQGLSAASLRLGDEAVHRLGVGTMRDMASVNSGVFLPVWQCRAYTLLDMFWICQGMR